MTTRQIPPESFWELLEAQLAEAPLDLSLARDDFYSEPEWDVYRLRYRSLSGYQLFAWISVPVGGGPFPALLRMPDYGSVHDLIYTSLRQHVIVMNATHRGQRNSDVAYQAQYPGLLTEGIEDPTSYLMYQVFADALRAVDALLGQTQAEVTTLALAGAGLGGSLALAAAARRSAVKAVASDTPLALGHPDILEQADGYPLAELNDYLRIMPQRRDTVLQASAPLNPVSLASNVKVPVLLSLGRRDRGLCPITIGEELAARLPDCDSRIYDGASEGGGHEHGLIRGRWLADQLGVAHPASGE